MVWLELVGMAVILVDSFFNRRTTLIYHDFIIKITNAAVIIAWLASKGIDVNRDEDGVILTKAEKLIGDICTPILRTADGNRYLRIRFKEKIATKIPDKPTYIMWRSDVEDPGEEPVYEVDVYGIDGNPNGTRPQAVGGF